MSVVRLFEKIGVDVKPRKTVGIYGPSMLGKSVLAAMLAREYCGPGGYVVVFGTEEHYADEEYRKLIASFAKPRYFINYCPDLESLFKYMNMVRAKRFEEKLALILDSLSFIAMREASKWSARGITEPRVIAARVIPALYSVSSYFKRLVVEKDALGVVVMHAASMAGMGKYRGFADLRPSMAMRVAHSLDHLVLLTGEKGNPDAPRKLTLVMSRLNPVMEGAQVEFTFTQLQKKQGKASK